MLLSLRSPLRAAWRLAVSLALGSLRAKRPSLIGTAGYSRPKGDRQPSGCPEGKRSAVKPVCPVVWDPWLALVSHGDPIRLF